VGLIFITFNFGEQGFACREQDFAHVELAFFSTVAVLVNRL
jgi:hypothetical protein